MKSPQFNQSLRDRIAQTLHTAEATVNWVSDSDREWWPFGFVRPKPEERITSGRALLLALLYAIPIALFAMIIATLVGDAPQQDHLLWFPLAVTVAFFVLFRGTFAYFWNRRASRLSLMASRRMAWQEAQRR